MPQGIYKRSEKEKERLKKMVMGLKHPNSGIYEHKKGYTLPPFTEEHKRKIAIGHMGIVFSDERKRNISNALKGNKNCLGRKLSKKHKEILLKSLIGHHYCPSEETRKKISNSLKGEKSYLWQGGITPKNLKIRKSIEIRLWREAVFTRDDYTCQKCGQYGWHLNAHHIKDFAEFIELRTSIKNGITFCEKCHRKFHRLFGLKNNNEGQLREFLRLKTEGKI